MKSAKCLKVAYDRIGALIALANHKEFRQNGKRPSRIYKCVNCKKWHVGVNRESA